MLSPLKTKFVKTKLFNVNKILDLQKSCKADIILLYTAYPFSTDLTSDIASLYLLKKNKPTLIMLLLIN